MLISVYISTRFIVYMYIRRGLQCCLFGSYGNTRASVCGTAILQSRFFVSMVEILKTNKQYEN